jgi:hypothetical protein
MLRLKALWATIKGKGVLVFSDGEIFVLAKDRSRRLSVVMTLKVWADREMESIVKNSENPKILKSKLEAIAKDFEDDMRIWL